MIKKEELLLIMGNLEKISENYNKNTKDLITINIVLEQQLVRLNHLLTNIRNLLSEQKK